MKNLISSFVYGNANKETLEEEFQRYIIHRENISRISNIEMIELIIDFMKIQSEPLKMCYYDGFCKQWFSPPKDSVFISKKDDTTVLVCDNFEFYNLTSFKSFKYVELKWYGNRMQVEITSLSENNHHWFTLSTIVNESI